MHGKNELKKRLISQAKRIFKNNLKTGYAKWKKTPYRFIAPSNTEYTYQFFWDTAFHALVLSHFDTDWAKSEIRNYLLAQKGDGTNFIGLIPQLFWKKTILM